MGNTYSLGYLGFEHAYAAFKDFIKHTWLTEQHGVWGISLDIDLDEGHYINIVTYPGKANYVRSLVYPEHLNVPVRVKEWYSDLKNEKRRGLRHFNSMRDDFARRDWLRHRGPWPYRLKLFAREQYYALRRGLREIKYLKGYISDFMHRGRYGWAGNDVMSLDHHLLKVLIGSLSYMRDNAHGYPMHYKSFEEWQFFLDWTVQALRDYEATLDNVAPVWIQDAALAVAQNALHDLVREWPCLWI